MGLRRKFVIAVSFAAGLVFWAASGTAAEGFFTGIDDLPVMPGLKQVADSGIAFDKPEGRIVEIAASGAVSRRQVIEFYQAVLPQLGWRPAGGGRYRREGEQLVLSIERTGRSLIVRFSLRPG
ncbi:MAG: hypothetical protein ACTSQV_01405 [Alphaproteobacteria bacterium]